MRLKKTVGVLLCVTSVAYGNAQTPRPVKADSVKATAQSGPVKYEKFFSGTTSTASGLFTVRSTDNKWFFEIPDSLLKRDILVVSRYKATPAGFGSYGGEEVNQQTICFEKFGDNKILLRSIDYSQEGKDSSQPLYQAVRNAGVNPIVMAFDIKTVNTATGSSVIEVTDLFKKENVITGINAREKADRKLSALADDRTFITGMRVYPINIEASSVRTYNVSGAGAGVVTVEMNSSLLLLPKVPMQKRFFDERVGFFASKYVLFDEADQAVKRKYIIQRYRMEPKPEDVEKYKRGELVEPAKPIVYYIDPATPKKWRPYLIAGVNDWQKAFEKAGFKNAIVGREWPENDTTMSLEDARFSVIRYLASETPNAYGPRISDPRSGEIMESHVGWYHNVMKLVHDWYMIQIGALDPRARKMQFDDELMGDLIRFVSSHEIGHTLGLRHNMGASAATPVEKLRDKKWVEANGHTNSIMDYARFNYVAQPEDNIGKEGLYPRIGAYDKWAIQWGYSQFYKGDAFEETTFLNQLIVDSLNSNPGLWFGGEGKNEDPRSQKEDLSNDVMQANDYGIKNLRRVVASLPEWTKEPGDLYQNLNEMHTAAVRQFSRYLMHVTQYINSRYITEKSIEQKGPVYQLVPADKMKRAVAFIGKHVFNPPLWLYPPYAQDLLGAKPATVLIEQQSYYMQLLLNVGMLANLQQNALDNPAAYKVEDFLNDIHAMVWDNMPSDEKGAFYRRALQRNFMERLGQVAYNKDLADYKTMATFWKTDVRILAMEHLKKLRVAIAQQLQQPMSAINRLHYTDMKQEIDRLIKKSTNP